MEDPPLQPTMTTQQSMFRKREANEPLAVLENSTSETDHCKRLCQEVKVKEEQYLDDDITEVTVPVTDPEDRILNGDTGDDGINDSAPITFSDLFQTHPELPVCWTEEQANYFRTQNPWLQIKNGRLGCGICIQVGSLSLHHQVRGSRLAREWLEFLISSTSETRKGQQTALRKKIWEHRESHAHQQAEKVLQKVQSGQLDGPVLNRTEEQETTCRIFRTAYMISKQNRPFSDMPDLVDLQVANGIDMGRVLHTRKSCAEICDFIGNEMKKKLTLFMAEKDVKFSILVEECTTVSNQSALAVCIRAPFGLKSEPLTIFFQLLELQEVTAEAVATELQVCLHEQFPQDYIARNWISFTADGASATLGWASGVATLLNTNDCYPNLVIWHCCNHKLELAVGEALQEVMGADHFKAFIDILYSLYQSSPKNQRELNICAEELAVLFKSTSRVIDTRSIASSCRAVSAIWNVYPALCAHFTSAAADPKRATAEKARYKALLERLTSVVFVKNLGIMRDALVKLYELSLRLQVNTITLPEAHILICLQIQDFQMSAGGKEGEFSKVAAEAAENLQFQDVALHTGRKADMEIKRESFFQSLTNSLQSRLITSSSRLPSSEGDGFYSDSEELFPACKIVYPQYWPAEFDVQYGEEEVRALCRRFQLPVQQSLQGFREYKDNGGKEVPELLLPLLMTLKTITISTAECERVFSDINNTITSYRNALHINRVSNLLFLQRNGPPFGEFRPESYVVTWLIQGHRSADYVACRERENKEEECNDDKKESQLLPGNNFTTECNIPGSFMCSNGLCIPGFWQCDGQPDCFDESDEKKCPKAKQKCNPNFFPCASGNHCIVGRFQCNGFEDCPDGSDEDNCTTNPLLCSTGRFHCKNGRCMDKSFVCDGQNNCQDNSDEENCDNHHEGGSGQDYVTSETQLLYYPSITYAIIGSSVIFVLVVALLALVLHHQRKRNNLMTLPVHRLQHPVLLSRLVVLDHPHHCSVTYNVNNSIQYVSGQGYQRPTGPESPPSYSEAVLDQSMPPWYNLPPPPYSTDASAAREVGLPPYRSQTGSFSSLDDSRMGNLDSNRTRGSSPITDNSRTPLERTPEPSDSLLGSISERDI